MTAPEGASVRARCSEGRRCEGATSMVGAVADDGRDCMGKFKSTAQAERLRSQLLVAASAAQPFDPVTGLPAEWVRVDLSFFEWAQQWLELKWPTWTGNSRRAGSRYSWRSRHTSSTRTLQRRRCPTQSSDPGCTTWPWTPMPRWTRPHRWLGGSIATRSASTRSVLASFEFALGRGLLRVDGRRLGATTATRRKNLLSTVLKAAANSSGPRPRPPNSDTDRWSKPAESSKPALPDRVPRSRRSGMGLCRQPLRGMGRRRIEFRSRGATHSVTIRRR